MPTATLPRTIRAGFSGGRVHMIYNDDLVPRIRENLGAQEVVVKRASHVECHEDASGWYADLRPVNGPVLDGFTRRDDALRAEVEYLNANVISKPNLFPNK